MIVTTTNSIDGKEITEYLGIITGEAIIGAHIFKDIFASIRDIVGGRSGAYEKTMKESKDIALKEIIGRAQQLNADAIVGVSIDHEVIGSKGMMMVTVTGTAIKYRAKLVES